MRGYIFLGLVALVRYLHVATLCPTARYKETRLAEDVCQERQAPDFDVLLPARRTWASATQIRPNRGQPAVPENAAPT